MRCPKCKCNFGDKSKEFAPDVCSDCADSEFPNEGVAGGVPPARRPTIQIAADKPWRPHRD